jgi:hypothetical protein
MEEVRILTLGAIFMQIPVLILLIIFSRHAFYYLGMKEFKLIYQGWIVNLLYIIVAAQLPL